MSSQPNALFEQMLRLQCPELIRLLRVFRERRNESQPDVEIRLTQARAQNPNQWDNPFVKSLFGRGIASFESANDSVLELSFDDLQRLLELLADVYAIPKLMLYPLLSEPKDDTCLVESLDHFLPVLTQAHEEHCMMGTRYAVPLTRLAATAEVALVELELAAYAETETHCHPGDELAFVLEGTVEVRLHNTGLWTRLNQWDYMHFYAEQQHSIRNLDERPAKLFIIRFYQLEPAGTRFEFLNELKAHKKKKAVTDRVFAEMVAAREPFTMAEPPQATTPIRDRFGLGRLLRLICSTEFQKTHKRLTLDALAKRASEKGLPFDRAKLNRIHHGQAPVSMEDMMQLAEHVYHLEPMLFYDFTSPAFQNAIAVRQPDDLEQMPAEYSRSANVKYHVPCRRLSDSDIAIAMLELAPGTGTPVNRHPGHELLLLLEGHVDVKVQNMTVSLDASKQQFAHYHSWRDHQVLNTGAVPAKQLVIRFYE